MICYPKTKHKITLHRYVPGICHMCWVSFMHVYSDLEKNTFVVKLIAINLDVDLKYDVIFTSGERVVGADCFGETCPVRKVAGQPWHKEEN